MTAQPSFGALFDRFIELRGDRTESAGTAITGGLGWLRDTRVVAIAAEQQPVLQPAALRRLIRLLYIAERFQRPVVLWEMRLFVTPDRGGNLLVVDTLRQARTQLSELSVPVIAILGASTKLPTWVDAATADGVVLASPPENPLDQSTKALKFNLQSANTTRQIQTATIALLQQASKIPSEARIRLRVSRLRALVFD